MFDLKVGFTCNNKCIHCVVDEKRERAPEDLTLDEIKGIIDSVEPNEGITLTGGEVSIRKDFLDILKYCKEKGHFVHIQTNGTGFSDINLAKSVAPYIDQVLIAIHSYREEVHNKIVGCTSETVSMYKKTIEGLDNLISCGIYFETQTVISSLNARDLYGTYSFIQSKKKGTFMHLTYPHPLGGAFTNSKDVVIRLSEINKYIKPCLRDFGNYLITEAIPYCYLFPYQDNILCNLEKIIFNQDYVRHGYDKSSYSKDKIIEDYNKEDYKSKRKPTQCSDCMFDYKCMGVWKEYCSFHKNSMDLFPINERDRRAVDSIDIDLSKDYTIDTMILGEGITRNSSLFKLHNIYNPYKEIRKNLDEFLLTFDFTVPMFSTKDLSDINYFLDFKNIGLVIDSDITEDIQSILEKVNNERIYLYIDISFINKEDIYKVLELFKGKTSLVFIRVFTSNSIENPSIVSNILDGLYSLGLKATFINLPRCYLPEEDSDENYQGRLQNLVYEKIFFDSEIGKIGFSEITVPIYECTNFKECIFNDRCFSLSDSYPITGNF